MQQLTTKGGFCPLYVQNWFASDQSREKMNDLNTKCPSLSQKGNGYCIRFVVGLIFSFFIFQTIMISRVIHHSNIIERMIIILP